jgi:hypothetical protein
MVYPRYALTQNIKINWYNYKIRLNLLIFIKIKDLEIN